ncbi:TPR-like protein [Wilcoxina mikolae CBS 423.85]|nr:TPR-like protein [Wilcoxina mikolae CBS 423.85]
MTGFEIAGVVLAGPAVVAQLLNVSIEGYKIFSEAQAAGKELHRCQQDLGVVQHRLEDWIGDLANVGGDLSAVFEKEPQRYITILQTLAYIAEVFVKVEQLQSKYGIKSVGPAEHLSPVTSIQSTETNNSNEAARGRRKRDRIKGFFRVEKSVSDDSKLLLLPPKPLHSDGGTLSLSRKAASSFTNLPLPSNNENTFLKHSRDLEHVIPDVNIIVNQMEKKAEQYQQTLSTYRRYEWVFSGHEELRTLVGDLDRYTTQLEQITKFRFQSDELTEQGMLAYQQSLAFSEFRIPTKLPLPQDPNFCGREDVFAKIKQCLGTEIDTSLRRVVVLVGLGGIGKSQIALEYGYRHTAPDCSVFWINATNQETVNLSSLRIMETLICHYSTKYRGLADFARISTDLGVPGRINSSGKLVVETGQSLWEMFRAWLSKDGNTNWCLVIDGYDDTNLINPSDLLPPGRHGHIIVTSRNMEVAGSLRGDFIEIPEIEQASGLELLVRVRQARDAAEKIIGILGGLPLALAQAAAYMMAVKDDFVRYLKRLTGNLSRILGKPFPSYPDGVFSCWKLSVEAANRHNPYAIGLLRLCAFLSGDGIPEELLYRGIKSMHWLSHGISRLDDSIDDLVKFSLIKRKLSPKGDGRALWIHPLVQLMARESCHKGESIVHERLPERQQVLRKQGVRDALCLVGTSVEAESYLRKGLDWTFEKSIATHIALCYEYISEYFSHNVEKEDAVDEELALVVYNLGEINFHWGRNDQAVQVLQIADRLYEMLPDQSRNVHAAALHTKEQLVFVKMEQSRSGWPELVEEAKEILVEQEELLGGNHRHTLETMDTTAMCLRRAGRLDDALELHLRCLKGVTESLGIRDAYFSVITNNLGYTYTMRGEYDKALEYLTMSLNCKLALEDEKKRGMFVTLSNLASTYEWLGQFDKALEFYHRAQSGYEEMFGLANSKTTESAYDLSYVYTKLGRFEDALKWGLQCFEGYTNLHGRVHASTLIAMYNVMVIYEKLERFDEVFRWAKDCLETCRRLYGEDHESTRNALTWVEFYGREDSPSSSSS